MKKIIVAILFLFCVNDISAQAFGLDLGIGLKGGLSAQKIKGDGLKGTYNTSPHLGAFAHLNKKRIGAQIEAVWTQNTVTTDSTFYGLYKQYYKNIYDSLTIGSFKFQTISIPILLNIKMTQKVWIQLGPQFVGSVSMADKKDILKSGTDIIKQQNYNFITGLWFKFGGDSPLLKINAGIRAIFGLNNLNALNTYEVWTNQLFQIHLGISY